MNDDPLLKAMCLPIDGRDLKLLLRSEMREKAAFTHFERGRQGPDRQPVESESGSPIDRSVEDFGSSGALWGSDDTLRD